MVYTASLAELLQAPAAETPAGAQSGTSATSTKPDINMASQIYEKVEVTPGGQALIITTFTQFLTYWEPIEN